MSTSRIAELASIVQASTKNVDDYLRANNLAQPSFDEDGPVKPNVDSAEVEISRMNAVDAALELHDLLIGPMELVRPVVRTTSWRLSLLLTCPVERHQSAVYIQV